MSAAQRLDALLSAAAGRHPDRPALRDRNRTWTYRELEHDVAALADALADRGVRAGDRIGVLAPKSAQAVLGIYAGLRAGAVVAPLDLSSPPARIRRMIAQAGLSLLVGTDASARTVHSAADSTESGPLGHGLSWTRVAGLPPAVPVEATAEGGYVLFTSGSTGWPKGVLLSHDNVAHFATWAADELDLGPSDRVGSQAALTFDLSTFDLFGSAAAGACVVLMPDRLRAFPADVVRWLDTEAITVLYAVPSLYTGMLERGGVDTAFPSALRTLVYAGEPFPPRALERYLDLAGDRPVYNLYGPTETNVCTWTRVSPDWRAGSPLPVGRAVPGDLVDVFDDAGRVPTVPGASGPGEICVAGATVFHGYLQDGRLVDPTRELRFADGVVRRAYPTGDLGHRTADGEIVLHGRRDAQLKRHGYRIDPGEIENVAMEHPQVAAAAVLAGADEQVTAYAEGTVAEMDLLVHLRGRLPAYMVPDRAVVLEQLPVNTRGKVDRSALAQTPEPVTAMRGGDR